MYFSRRIKVTIDHGLDNLLAADIDGISYWYQEEPHIPFEPLPPACQRRPISTAGNRLTMAVPLLYATAAFLAGRGIKKVLSGRDSSPS
jgi:hypothetical protein